MIDEGNRLVIHTEKGFSLRSTKGIKVYIGSPVFKNFEASGACDIFSENKITSAEMIAVDLSGSCGVKMELDAPKVDAHLSGACNVQLKGNTNNNKQKFSLRNNKASLQGHKWQVRFQLSFLSIYL